MNANPARSPRSTAAAPGGADRPRPTEGDAEVADAADRPAKRPWRPAEIHRVRNLSMRDQRIFAAIVAGLVLLPILSAIIVLSQGWRPSGDNALISLRAHDVLTGHLPLVGQPTTGENFGGGIESSHPGPIEFYLIAPFTLLLGPTIGLALGAALINSAALGAIGFLSFRRGGLQLLFGTSVATVLLARSLGGNFLHDPVSSNVGAVMSLALLFAAWSLIAGDLRTIPIFVLVGSFSLQDHLTYLGTGAPVILLAIGFGIWWIRRTFRFAVDSSWLRPRLIASVVLGLVLWLPVVIDQFFGSHNLSAIIETFTTKKGKSEGLGFAVKRLAEALAPWPIFSRKVPTLGYLHTPATHEIVLGYLVLFAVIGLGIHVWRSRRTDLTAMALTAVVAAGAGLYTSIKLPSGAGVKASNLRWMWTVSAFTWIALAWMIWCVLPALAKEVAGMPVIIFGSVTVALAMVGVMGSVGLATDRDGTIAKETTTLIDRVERELPKGRYRVTYAGGSVVLSIGPALVHDLEFRGDTVLLDVGPFTRAYAKHRTYTDQDVDGTVLITAEANAAYPPGTRLLGRQRFLVNANDKELQTIRVFLVEGSP